MRSKDDKRVYFVANALLPNKKAHGIQILQMCASFEANGRKTILILPRIQGETESSIKNFYNVKSDFSIRFLPTIAFPKSFERISFALRWLSFSITSLLYLFFKAQKKDLVYVRGEMILPLSIISSRVRLCWETHIKPGRMIMYMWAMNRCHAVVTATKIYRDELINEFKIDPYKIIVEPDAVDIEKFECLTTINEAKKKLNLPQDRKIIMYCGSDIPWKGLNILQDAILKLPEQYLGVFVGNVKHIYETDKRFLYVGFKPHQQIPLWLCAADLLVITGRKNTPEAEQYTSPLKLFEYIAAKKPIVAFDLPSFREILSEDMAFFVPSDNPEQIAAKIQNIPDEESKLKSETAYRNIQAHTWPLRVFRILKHVESLGI